MNFQAKVKLKILEIATNKMFLPILYTGLTTICAFLSLIFSGIKPVDFGWMMTIGLITSMITTFTLLPTFINLSSDNNIFGLKSDTKSKITNFLSNYTLKNKI